MTQKQLSLLEFARLRSPGVGDVAATADDIIEELGLEPPIDPGIIASYLGVRRIDRAPLDVAGCLICGSQGVLIKVRDSDSHTRQRFTIFHECVHTWFPGYQHRVQYRCEPTHELSGNGELEALCDSGASSLLLPRRFVVRDLEQAGFGVPALREVADKYDSSLEATGHRIVDLAREPTLFVVMEVKNKPADRNDPHAEPKLRVRTARGTPQAWPYIRPYKSVSDGSPLARALEGEVVREHGALEEIGASRVDDVEISARLVPHGGVQRVLALYRRRS